MNRKTVTLVDGYVPVIDLSGRDSATGRHSLAKAIGKACRSSGFFTIVEHGVSPDLIRRMYTVTNSFFTQSDADKDLVANRPGVSGFRRFSGNTAQSLDRATPPDLCEAFGAHVTGELSDQERQRLGDYWATWKLANIWPTEPAGFKQTWHEYMDVMGRLSHDLMRLLALALELEEDFFEDFFDRHVSSLVANYYYPQLEKPLPGQLRRGAHTDFGGLTILYQEDDLSGLQVQQDDGGWRDVPPVPGSFVVNIGDLMALWSGGRWVSTMHRVANPEQGNTSSRLSIPFFHQPNHDARIEPLEPVVGDGQDLEAVVAGEWMAMKTQKLFAAAS